MPHFLQRAATLRNGVLYAKPFYKCSLQIYVSSILYREHTAWIGPCLENARVQKELLHVLRETPVEM